MTIVKITMKRFGINKKIAKEREQYIVDDVDDEQIPFILCIKNRCEEILA